MRNTFLFTFFNYRTLGNHELSHLGKGIKPITVAQSSVSCPCEYAWSSLKLEFLRTLFLVILFISASYTTCMSFILVSTHMSSDSSFRGGARPARNRSTLSLLDSSCLMKKSIKAEALDPGEEPVEGRESVEFELDLPLAFVLEFLADPEVR